MFTLYSFLQLHLAMHRDLTSAALPRPKISDLTLVL